MLAIERRWMNGVMQGWAPGLSVDWSAGVERFLERASAKGRLGVRVGVLLAVTAPLWLWGRLRAATSLSAEERARLLAQMLTHRFFFVRELTLLLKLVGCMALFSASDLRAQSGYDPADERADDSSRRRASGRQLKVLSAALEEVA